MIDNPETAHQETAGRSTRTRRTWSGPASVRRQLPVTLRLVHVALLPLAAIGAASVIWRMKLADEAAELVLAGAMAIALSPTFSDRAATTLAASPTSPSRRAMARLCIVVPVAGVCWFVARVAAAHPLPDAPPLGSLTTWMPGRQAWMIFAVLTSLVLAIEALAARSAAIPGIGGSSTVLVASAIAVNAPSALAVFPVDAHWWRWGAVLIGSLVAIVVAVHDPGLVHRRNRAGAA